MKVNESNLDRILRAIGGILLLVLALANVLSGTVGIISLVIGVILLLTALTGFCPLYVLLKIKTNK